MKVDLGNQVALVTGAARHIGKAIGDTLAENGARVVYTDVDFNEFPDSCLDLGRHRKAIMNVVDQQQIEEVFSQTIEEWGRIDIVVNNAGLICMKHRVTIDQFPHAEWSRILDVDLTGVFLVSQAAASRMLPQRSGRIINIASVAGLVPVRLQSPYNAAKAGVINLTRAMAAELGSRGVLANCIAPGSILTEATRSLFYGNGNELSEKVKRMLDHVPLGRPGEPCDIANAALFLAAPESRYITGHCLTVDGGWTAGYLRDF